MNTNVTIIKAVLIIRINPSFALLVEGKIYTYEYLLFNHLEIRSKYVEHLVCATNQDLHLPCLFYQGEITERHKNLRLL